jgi:hypothetical protein
LKKKIYILPKSIKDIYIFVFQNMFKNKKNKLIEYFIVSSISENIQSYNQDEIFRKKDKKKKSFSFLKKLFFY